MSKKKEMLNLRQQKRTIHFLSWMILLISLCIGRAEKHQPHLRSDDHRELTELSSACNGTFHIVKAGVSSSTPFNDVLLGTYVNGSTIDIEPFNNGPISLVVSCQASLSYLKLKYLDYTTREYNQPYSLKGNARSNFKAEPDLNVIGDKRLILQGYRSSTRILETLIVFKIIKSDPPTCTGAFSIVKADLPSSTPLNEVVLGSYISGSSIDITPFNNAPLSLVVLCQGSFTYLDLKYLDYTTREYIQPYALKGKENSIYISEPDLNVVGDKALLVQGYRSSTRILETLIVFKIIKSEPTCDPPCHLNAICTDGNICQCLTDFDGNGRVCCDSSAQLIFDETTQTCLQIGLFVAPNRVMKDKDGVLTFTVFPGIVADTNLNPVNLYDNQGRFFGSAVDDGSSSSGDLVAGDGIFTSRFAFRFNDIGTVKFSAKIGSVQFEKDISVVEGGVVPEISRLEDAQKNFYELAANLSTADSLTQVYNGLLADLPPNIQADEVILNLGDKPSLLWTTLEGFVTVMVPYLPSMYPPNWGYWEPDFSGMEENSSSIVPEDVQIETHTCGEAIEISFFGMQKSNFLSNVAGIRCKQTHTARSYGPSDDDPLFILKDLDQFFAVSVVSRTYENVQKGIFALQTDVPCTLSNLKGVEADMIAGRVINANGYLAVTPSFFDFYTGSFDGGVVYLGGSKTFSSQGVPSGFVSVFQSKNVGAFYGHVDDWSGERDVSKGIWSSVHSSAVDVPCIVSQQCNSTDNLYRIPSSCTKTNEPGSRDLTMIIIPKPPIPKLKVTYTWPSTAKDLDTGTEFFKNQVGYACSGSPYMTFSGDDTSAGGKEIVLVDLQGSLDLGLWKKSEGVRVNLRAGWFQGNSGSGPATVTVEFDDGSSASRPRIITPGTQSGCASTCVGTVVIYWDEPRIRARLVTGDVCADEYISWRYPIDPSAGPNDCYEREYEKVSFVTVGPDAPAEISAILPIVSERTFVDDISREAMEKAMAIMEIKESQNCLYNECDAFRHAYFGYRLTIQLRDKFGYDLYDLTENGAPAIAKRICDADERTRSEEFSRCFVNLKNYEIGRKLASTKTYSTVEGAVIVIKEALDLKQLVVNPVDSCDGIKAFAQCYKTVTDTNMAITNFISEHGKLASVKEVNTKSSSNDYDVTLTFLILTNSDKPDSNKPKAFFMSGLHAREYAPVAVLLQFAKNLVEKHASGQDPDITWLLDYHEIHLLILANPNGRIEAEKKGSLHRKNGNKNYCGDGENYGADLNRNFKIDWHPLDEKYWGFPGGEECFELYPGPQPYSEPEVMMIQDYTKNIFPTGQSYSGIAVDVHAYGRKVLYPWNYQKNGNDKSTSFQALARKLAHFNHYSPIQGFDLYEDGGTSGTSIDYFFGELKVAALAFEIGEFPLDIKGVDLLELFHSSCFKFESEILPDNLESLMFAAKVARDPFELGLGPIISSGPNCPTDPIPQGTMVSISATIESISTTADGSLPAIDYAMVYVGKLPWTDQGVRMNVDNVNFDSSIVEVSAANIDTKDLDVRDDHLVYVQGVDKNGHKGAVSACFLKISPKI